MLKRAGISRPPRPAREPANRYEWPCPGDLLHMDTSEYARFQRPGHRVTGDRSSQDRQHRDGVDYVHAIVDDHSRLAYAEIHADQRAATVVGFLERALAFYAEHGIIAKRLMTDNAWTYVKSRDLRRLLDRTRDPAPHDQAVPAPHQRQGRALPPDDGARMGLRARLRTHTANAPPPCHTGSTIGGAEVRRALLADGGDALVDVRPRHVEELERERRVERRARRAAASC